ncbi:ArsR/SmtB family transcription factor [Paenibacillus sp. 1P07SE]|uniref:ArsR/SmtB family transcription factor n=1 Tax=Paenibacillus sp. 1P07SE TaxID=3132209 RepID=UPI0039A5375D
MQRNKDAIFKALSDSTRRLILDELCERNAQTMYELTVRLISNHGLSLTRQAIAKHLAALEEAGLVTSEKQGKYRVVIFHPEPLVGLLDTWTDKHHPEEEDK